MVPSKRKLDASGKAVCIVFRGDCRGFRFSDCIEYQVLWHAAGIERYLPPPFTTTAITISFRSLFCSTSLSLPFSRSRTLACGIVRLSDVLEQTYSHVNIRVGKEDYFRPVADNALEEYYKDHTRYTLTIPDKEHDSTTAFFGRTMLEWDFFRKNRLSIAKTSLKAKKEAASDDESDTEEEEGAIPG